MTTRQRSVRVVLLAVGTSLAFLLTRASSQTPAVTADCDRNGTVDFSEAIRAISIALGRARLSDCRSADHNGSGRIEIDEAVAAVRNAVAGSVDSPTATPLPATPTAASGASATPTPTRPATITPTRTASATGSPTPTGEPSSTPTPTLRETEPPSPTFTPVPATMPPTATPSRTATPTPSATATRTPPSTSTSTPTPTLGEARPLTVVGPVFQVNTYTIDDQSDPSVCRAADGKFVVTWFSEHTGGAVGHRFADDGARIGQEFEAGGTSVSVACDADGDFVTASVAQDGDTTGVFARRFASNGATLGTPFLVHQQTAGPQTQPDVCGTNSGDFVVTWRSPDATGDPAGIFARRFGSNGSSLVGEFRVNAMTVGFQSQPAVACGSSGFDIVWLDSSTGRITGRRFDGVGAPISTEFSSPPQSGFTLREPDVARGTTGELAVLWQADRTESGFDDTNRVRAQRYGIEGMKLASELDLTASRHVSLLPAAAALPDGAMFVAAQTQLVGTCSAQSCSFSDFICLEQARDFPICRMGRCCDTPLIPPQVTARSLSGSGRLRNTQIEVSAFTATAHLQPAVAADAGGDVVVVWRTFLDSSAGGIFGRQFKRMQPPYREFLAPCEGNGDVWSFDVAADQPITIQVDTLDPATAADLCFDVECDGVSIAGDDEADCSFPPSGFGCPARSFVAPSTSTCALTVAVCSKICAATARANYALVVDVNGAPLPLTLVNQGVPTTPTGTPKRTLTPTPTPTRGPSEALQLTVALYRALDDTLYVVVPGIAGRRVKVTSLAIATGNVIAHRESFAPGLTPSDFVLTSLAAAEAVEGDGDPLLPLASTRSSGIVHGLTAHPSVQTPLFDACAVSGAGLLTLPGGRQVTSLGQGPHAPQAAALTSLATPAAGVPAAVTKRISRRINAGNVTRRAIVFPVPRPGPVSDAKPSQCARSANGGDHCADDLECEVSCTQIGQGCCGLASSPPRCTAQPLVCEPNEPSSCKGVGACSLLGGEVADQTITIDDTLDTPFGNPASSDAPTDGILLEGECTGSSDCDAIVLVVDAGPLADLVRVAAAGFVLDGDDQVIGTAGGTGMAGAQAFPGSDVSCSDPRESLLNSTTQGIQAEPALCHTPAGNLVSVWTGTGIRAQRFDGGGAALGSELQLHDAAGEDSAVCCLPDGGFVVAWSEADIDGDEEGVFARRFSSGGTALGSEFQVNSTTSGPQYRAAIACFPDSSFQVVWMDGTLSLPLPFPTPPEPKSYGQRFQSSGARLGTEFLVSVPSFGDSPTFGAFPAICSAPQGESATVWTRYLPKFQQFFVAVTHRFSADGQPLEIPSEHFSFNADNQLHAAVACAPAGGTFVAYEGSDRNTGTVSPGADGSGDGIFAYGLTSEFRVNSHTPGNQRAPTVARDSQGGYLVAWTSDGQDGSDLGIYARRFTSTGESDGAEFRLNSATAGAQSEPVVSCAAGGPCVVSWTGPDGSGGTDVFARRLP